MTRIERIYTDLIRNNPLNPPDPRSIGFRQVTFFNLRFPRIERIFADQIR